jgi:hypothetical protein
MPQAWCRSRLTTYTCTSHYLLVPSYLCHPLAYRLGKRTYIAYLMRAQSLKWAVPVLAATIFTPLGWWSFTFTMAHSAGGCDGGLCIFKLLWLPLYGLAYGFLVVVALWLGQPKTGWAGIGAATCLLVSWGIAAVLQESSASSYPATVLQRCCLLLLVAMLVILGRRVVIKTPPLKPRV